MFYQIKVKDFVRVSPDKFEKDLNDAMTLEIKEKYEGHISEELGTIIDVSSIDEVKEGVMIPGDGATFYHAEFTLLSFIPEAKEVILGTIRDIADFGAFISIGPNEGMIHISQTMNDFVSYSDTKSLQGKDTNRSLNIGDNCKARIVSVSYRDLSNPKIGLTMRQVGLGRDEWIVNDIANSKKTSSSGGQ